MSNWINVKDRLPEISGWFLVYYCGEIEVLHFNKKDKEWKDTMGDVMKVTHWQPLPEPPSSLFDDLPESQKLSAITMNILRLKPESVEFLIKDLQERMKSI